MTGIVESLASVRRLLKEEDDLAGVGKPFCALAERALLARTGDDEEVVVRPTIGSTAELSHGAEGDETHDAGVRLESAAKVLGKAAIAFKIHSLESPMRTERYQHR